MTTIDNSLISKLRKEIGAGMMDCKKALQENDGNYELAVDWLRKKGLASAAKKSSRVAAEGVIGILVKDKKAAIIELNSETDFSARNQKFQDLAKNILDVAIDNNNVESIKSTKYPGSDRNIEDEIAENIATIGENINLRRSSNISVNNGVIASYIHNQLSPNLGKIGVLVALESEGDKEKLLELGKQIAMHIAASKPEALNIDNVDSMALEREREIFTEQARSSGKPDSIIEKMVEGRIRKYYEEIVLLEQIFVIDGKTKISDLLVSQKSEIGSDVIIKDFALFILGEGIEQNNSNFADEVKAASGL